MSQEERKTYIVFDRSTGAVIGTHLVYDARTRTYVEHAPENVLEIFHGSMKGRTSDQIGVSEISLPRGRDVSGYFFDVKAKKLVPRLRLDVKPERTQLQGDGKDTIQIQIGVLGDGGKVADDFNGELRVTTTRGRLSASGGQIKATQGRGSIKLTSVAETVDRVWLTVRDLAGRCARGKAVVEFV